MADLLDKDFNNSIKNIHRTKGRCGESKKKKRYVNISDISLKS